jgi:hypothetical protein
MHAVQCREVEWTRMVRNLREWMWQVVERKKAVFGEATGGGC